jgi:hypothetical protein
VTEKSDEAQKYEQEEKDFHEEISFTVDPNRRLEKYSD